MTILLTSKMIKEASHPHILILNKVKDEIDKLNQKERLKLFRDAIVASLPFKANIEAIEMTARSGSIEPGNAILNTVRASLEFEINRVKRAEKILSETEFSRDIICKVYIYYLAYQSFILRFVNEWGKYDQLSAAAFQNLYRRLTDYVHADYVIGMLDIVIYYYGKERITAFTSHGTMKTYEYPYLCNTVYLSRLVGLSTETDPMLALYYKNLHSDLENIGCTENHLINVERLEDLKDFCYSPQEFGMIHLRSFVDIDDIEVRKKMVLEYLSAFDKDAEYSDNLLDNRVYRDKFAFTLYPVIERLLDFRRQCGSSDFLLDNKPTGTDTLSKLYNYVIKSHKQIHRIAAVIALVERYKDIRD